MGVCGICCGKLPVDELLNFAEAINILAEQETGTQRYLVKKEEK